MKKILSFMATITLCLLVLITATSCSSKNQIKEFKEKLDKDNNYQVAVTMSDLPVFGTLTMTIKVDGNIEYCPSILFSDEMYIETVDDVHYSYTKDEEGKWIKTKVEDLEGETSEVYTEEDLNELFNPDKYEKVKGEKNTYKQKADADFKNFEDVKIVFKDNTCTIEMSSTVEGMTIGMKFVFSKIGEIELTLPEVNDSSDLK